MESQSGPRRKLRAQHLGFESLQALPRSVVGHDMLEVPLLDRVQFRAGQGSRLGNDIEQPIDLTMLDVKTVWAFRQQVRDMARFRSYENVRAAGWPKHHRLWMCVLDP